MQTIDKIANKISLAAKDLYMYGNYKAKIIKEYSEFKEKQIILVTAMSPTPYGEGKTTVAIGLNDALNKLNVKSLAVLREPSMGPVFGVKGGATGGGKAIIEPQTDINLHFTGDFHAITTANNLIASVIDNHIYHKSELNIDKDKVCFQRTIDLNDRFLRNVQVNIRKNVTREEHFTITAASEVMTAFCLAQDFQDLEERLNNIKIAESCDKKELFVKDLNITGALLAILKDSFYPNLVQSLENNPVLVHGGPFANIATGCSSVISLKTATNLAEVVVTEAGFGSDLGAIKFLDIVARNNNIKPSCIVLVVTLRALKYHSENNYDNLIAHLSILKQMHSNVVITLNKFSDDKEEDIKELQDYVNNLNIPFIINDVYNQGGDGAIDLAKEVLKYQPLKPNYLYNLDDKLEDKIDTICTKLYNASEVKYSDQAVKKLATIKEEYPICIAKTQYSISDNKNLKGMPKDFIMEVTDIKVCNGSKFILVLMGNILTMPGLNENPSATLIKVNQNKEIINIK